MKIKIILVWLFFVLSPQVFSDQDKFHIEGDEAVGSKFKEKDASSSIPFNRRYRELSAEQKAAFRTNYQGILPTETPPFPREGLQAIYRPIIKGHQKRAREGNLFAIALVGDDGMVKKVDVYKAPDKYMAELAVTVLYNTQFDPATCDGKPCQMEFPLDIRLEVTF